MSSIGWTSETWNPTTGCDRISAGCDACYALTLARRLKAMGVPAYQNDGDPRTSGPGFALTLHPDRLRDPRHWRKPRVVFVNSMSDLAHKDVPAEFFWQVMDMMAEAERHVFQVLTKRPKRLRAHVNSWYALRDPLGEGPPLPNLWLGVSVESGREERRIAGLREVYAAVHFISAEPLIAPPSSGLDLRGIDWVIIGGESGLGARRMDLDWARAWVAAARAAGAAVFVKQLGTVLARERGAPGKGEDLSFFPPDLRLREMPRGHEALLDLVT